MSKRLQVLVPEELDARMRKAADRARTSKGEWVRVAIEGRLAEEEQGLPADPLAALAELRAPTSDITTMLAEIEAGRR